MKLEFRASNHSSCPKFFVAAKLVLFSYDQFGVCFCLNVSTIAEIQEKDFF